jgi:bifunctional non-homologous end joining protein LigD
VRLLTRNGNDWTSKLQSLADALRSLKLPPAWLDGEIVVPGPAGAPDFNALQNAFESSRIERICYYLFDVPYAPGTTCAGPAACARALLRLAAAGRATRASATARTSSRRPQQILQHACRLKLEGVIGKRRDSPYLSRRSTTGSS